MSSGYNINGVEISYSGRMILKAVSFEIREGSNGALMGPSGSGKSSLLRCLSGTMRPAQGTVQLNDVLISELSEVDAARVRRQRIGLISQEPDLLPELSVVENVVVSLLFDGARRRDALDIGADWLARVGMAGKETRRVDEISGGEAQRVAVARALCRPGLAAIVADEPTASLDARNAALITELILTEAATERACVVLATHDPAVAARCDSIVELRMPVGVRP